ncbi:MAG: putative thiosulfate sulfurtransferase [Tardiphaga sp.]|jgi:rhodanese-related sulfurtransferase|nr:putative thiosulfate sulfurtransferase [Tardiphaga sp.]
MPKLIAAETIRAAWRGGHEIALFDLREEGPYSLSHPFFAVSLPLAQIELRIGDLVPRRSAPIVVYDDGEGLTQRGVERIEALGYSDVSVLDGGLAAYARAGEVFRDVNVPSKAFGELVESIRHTPSLPAEEIAELIAENPDVVVLDARRFEEYHTMSIPRGVSVPGGELALRVHDLAPSPDTTIVVNCAGRTRSIIGTQTLVNAGVTNRVIALRNGTIGWTLAGFELERGRTGRFGAVSAEAHTLARDRAGAWAQKVGVAVIDTATLARYRSEAGERTLYLLDVRTPQEYAERHPEGFVSAPGGQLVQATDEWVAVRGARLVLFDDDGVRARMSASWLVQMGWDACVVAEGALVATETRRPDPVAIPAPGVPSLLADELAELGDSIVVDLGPSPLYRRGHIPGAWFVAGTALADLAALPEGPIVLTSPDGRLAAAHAQDVAAATSRTVYWLEGGNAGWQLSGRPLTADAPRFVRPPDDVYKRPYEGTDNPVAPMQEYIEWELQLVAQLANDGICRFHVVR